MSELSAEQPHEEQAPPSANSFAIPEKKSKVPLIIIAIVIVSCLCISVCVISGGWGAVSGIIKANQERDNAEAVIDEFMMAMAEKDTLAAYAMFSTRAQRQTPVSSVEEMHQGNNFALFEGYQNTSVTSIKFKKAYYTNEDIPQGNLLEIQGAIEYDGGIIGKVTAVLEEENDQWRLVNIYVTVPPDKIGNP